MQRQVATCLAIILAVSNFSPAVWADENPKAAKTGEEVRRQAREPMQNEEVPRAREPIRADESPEVGNTNPLHVKKDESAVAAPEAAAGEITVSWKGGQLVFPVTGSKESDLKLRCTGKVIIEGKGITAETAGLEVRIEGKRVAAKASNVSLRCSGAVMIEWKGFTAMAADLQYDAEKDLFTLSSGGKPDGCTFRSTNKDGTSAVLIADQISVSPSSTKVSCVGVKEYKAVEQPSHVPPPTSAYGMAPTLTPNTYLPPPGTGTYPSSAPATAPPTALGR